jgi:hypothetical protein
MLRRLFEREADNHHEEPLLLAQHAAAALRYVLGQRRQQQQQVLQGGSCDGAASADTAATLVADGVVGEWCASMVQRFLPAVVDTLKTSSGGSGSGGSAGHPEVFVPLYRCCLGLWAAQPWLLLQQQQQCRGELQGPDGGVQAARQGLRSAADRLVDRLASLSLPDGLGQAVQLGRSGNAGCDTQRLLFLLQ